MAAPQGGSSNISLQLEQCYEQRNMYGTTKHRQEEQHKEQFMQLD